MTSVTLIDANPKDYRDRFIVEIDLSGEDKHAIKSFIKKLNEINYCWSRQLANIIENK